MADFTEEARIFADLIKDKNRLKAQIASTTNTYQIRKGFSSTMVPKVLHYKVNERTKDNEFTLGDASNGILGTSPLWERGQGMSVKYVLNPEDTFWEYFDTEDYQDSTYTNSTVDTTAMEVTFTKGQIYQTDVAYDNDTAIKTVKPQIYIRTAQGGIKIKAGIPQRLDIYVDRL